MNTDYRPPFNDETLSDRQKCEIDNIVICFRKKLISVSDLCSRIETIKFGHDTTIFSCPQWPGHVDPVRRQ